MICLQKLISELLHDPSPTRVRTVLKSQRATLEGRLSQAQVALAKLDRIVQEERSRSTAQATDPARNPLARLSDTAIARLHRAQELAEQYVMTWSVTTCGVRKCRQARVRHLERVMFSG